MRVRVCVCVRARVRASAHARVCASAGGRTRVRAHLSHSKRRMRILDWPGTLCHAHPQSLSVCGSMCGCAVNAHPPTPSFLSSSAGSTPVETNALPALHTRARARSSADARRQGRTHARARGSMHTREHARKRSHASTDAHKHTSTHTHTHTRAYTRVHTHTRARARARALTPSHTHTHTHAHAHTRTRTSTHTHLSPSSPPSVSPCGVRHSSVSGSSSHGSPASYRLSSLPPHATTCVLERFLVARSKALAATPPGLGVPKVPRYLTASAVSSSAYSAVRTNRPLRLAERAPSSDTR